ncbi:MAG: hypothetical protein K9N23_23220 [Akkermansiaceae bacterium]|nr:hypothetical protein [Akkermansiaceae bacterium]
MNRSVFSAVVGCCAALWVLAATGLAQSLADPAAKPAVSHRFLRLLPVGEPPPYEEEVRDGIRYEVEPAPNSIPPRQIVLGEGETAITLRLNLSRVTEPVKLPVGTAPVVLRVVGTSPDVLPVPWFTLRPPETGNVLALLWRDPGKPWSKPRSLLLPDSAAAFPAGNIRIVNLLPVETAVILGKDRIVAGAGKTVLRAIAVGTDLPLQVAYRTQAGKLQGFHSGSVLLNPNDRTQVVVYRADGENPRRPAKVVVFNEATPVAKTAPQPPPR